jgi:hypothetical protein
MNPSRTINLRIRLLSNCLIKTGSYSERSFSWLRKFISTKKVKMASREFSISSVRVSKNANQIREKSLYPISSWLEGDQVFLQLLIVFRES